MSVTRTPRSAARTISRSMRSPRRYGDSITRVWRVPEIIDRSSSRIDPRAALWLRTKSPVGRGVRQLDRRAVPTRAVVGGEVGDERTLDPDHEVVPRVVVVGDVDTADVRDPLVEDHELLVVAMQQVAPEGTRRCRPAYPDRVVTESVEERMRSDPFLSHLGQPVHEQRVEIAQDDVTVVVDGQTHLDPAVRTFEQHRAERLAAGVAFEGGELDVKDLPARARFRAERGHERVGADEHSEGIGGAGAPRPVPRSPDPRPPDPTPVTGSTRSGCERGARAQALPVRDGLVGGGAGERLGHAALDPRRHPAERVGVAARRR